MEKAVGTLHDNGKVGCLLNFLFLVLSFLHCCYSHLLLDKYYQSPYTPFRSVIDVGLILLRSKASL